MVKVAIAGAGFMGKTHFDRYRNNPDCNVICVYDTQIERARTFDVKTATDNFNHVLDSEADVVDICLPTFQHMGHCVKAATAKKHVFCEKPMAISLDECNTMIEVCQSNGVKLMIAHVIRFWPEYRFIREAVQDKRFGKLLYIRSGRRQAMPSWTVGNWMADPALSLGGVVDFQIHDIDFMLSLFGMPKSLKSIGTQSVFGGWEQITTVMRHATAVSCTEACNMMPNGYPFIATFCALFEKASVDYDCRQGRSLVVHKPDEEPFYPHLGEKDGYQNEIDYYIACVKDGRDIHDATGEHGAMALKLALLTKNSLENGHEIHLN